MTARDNEKNIHTGHRKRLLERFSRDGFDGWQNHVKKVGVSAIDSSYLILEYSSNLRVLATFGSKMLFRNVKS